MSSVTDCQLKVLHKEIFLQMAFKLINCTKQSVLNFHSSHYKISIQTSKPLQKKKYRVLQYQVPTTGIPTVHYHEIHIQNFEKKCFSQIVSIQTVL